eukprot:1611180-Rhodomonas_salina.1
MMRRRVFLRGFFLPFPWIDVCGDWPHHHGMMPLAVLAVMQCIACKSAPAPRPPRRDLGHQTRLGTITVTVTVTGTVLIKIATRGQAPPGRAWILPGQRTVGRMELRVSKVRVPRYFPDFFAVAKRP